jgi:DnaJ-domain-containing protein 1
VTLHSEFSCNEIDSKQSQNRGGWVAADDDPRGHYRALGLAPNATQAQISHAYREWAKAYHPDRSGNADARDFHRIKEAYDTLVDEGLRARYDAEKHADTNDAAEAARCCVCAMISAQPRYCIFHRVISAIVRCHVVRPQGIYCPRCAASQSLRESAISSLLGWWSVAGVIRTPIALWHNFWIGEKPHDENARLLMTQARYFLSIKHKVLAASCLEQATWFANGSAAETLSGLRQSLGERVAGPGRSDWAPYRHAGPYLHALPLIILAAVTLSFSLRRCSNATIPESGISPHPLSSQSEPSSIDRRVRHVVSRSATIWVSQDGDYVNSGYLPQFTTVVVLGPTSNPNFVATLLPNGTSAILATDALALGDGTEAKVRLCHDPVPDPLRNGEVVRRVRSGPNRVVVNNTGGDEMMVKFRDLDGGVTIALFVAGQSQAVITDFPNGSYRFEFATGALWSRKCGLFERGMYARKFPVVETFGGRKEGLMRQGKHVTVNPPDFAEFTVPDDRSGSAHAEPIDEEAFILD